MSSLPADWFLLLLRLLFVFLLYFFLYQLFRVQVRQLLAAGTGSLSETPQTPISLPRLLVRSDGLIAVASGTIFALHPFSTVGRHPDSTVYVADASTSSAHAEIRLSGRQWWIADLNSTNGTFVNGSRIHQPAPIDVGDVVQFGRVEMELVQ